MESGYGPPVRGVIGIETEHNLWFPANNPCVRESLDPVTSANSGSSNRVRSVASPVPVR